MIGEPISAAESKAFRITLGDMLDRTIQREGAGEAVVFPDHGVRLTYREFGALVDRTAKGLLALGIKKGEHIALWSPTSPYWLYVQYAAAKVGAVLVTANTYFKASELEYVLGQSESSTLLLAGGFRDVDYLSVLESVCPELAAERQGGLVSSRLPLLRRAIFLGDKSRRGLIPFRELLDLGEGVSDRALAERQQSLGPDDAVNLVYTSGTTGFPKGALISHSALMGVAYWLGRELGYKPSDRSHQPAPLFTVGGLIGGSLIPLYFGATIVGLGSFDPVAVMKLVADERCTVLYGVPTMFIAILDHPDFADHYINTLDRAYLAGSPCPIEMMKDIESRMHVRAIIGCGLTETSGTPLITRMDDPAEIRLATVGRPMPGIEIKVIDPETGREVASGEQGDLLYRGWALMKGYYKMADAAGATIDSEGWLHSGDLATINERGYVNITGRIKDMIIRGGLNIYAREVEEYLHSHPKISDVYIVGVPDRKYGEEVLACVKLKPGQECTEDEVRDYCRKGLARFKVPRYVMFIDAFPMTAMGKVQKFKLVENGIAHFDLEKQRSGRTA